MSSINSKNAAGSSSTGNSNNSGEDNKTRLQDYRQNSFESRYSSMITKQIMENNINHEELKRQLHIFMPFAAGKEHKDITRKKLLMDRDANSSLDASQDDDFDDVAV